MDNAVAVALEIVPRPPHASDDPVLFFVKAASAAHWVGGPGRSHAHFAEDLTEPSFVTACPGSLVKVKADTPALAS